MKKFSALVILGLAACGGSTKKTATVGSATTPARDVFGMLFEQGKSWTFALETKITPPMDIGQPTTTVDGPMTCSVDNVRTIGDARVAKLTCKGSTDENLPTMYWLRNAQGLWGYYAGMDEAELAKQFASPNPKEMLLAAVPFAHKTEAKDADGAISIHWAKPGDAGTWCTGYTFAMGDEAGWEMCFKPGVGIVSGNWFDAGATTTEHRYN